MQKLPDALWIAAAMIPLGAMAGLAALLRSKQELTSRGVLAAFLNSGILAAAICALMFHRFPEAVLLNIALSLLAGLGGNTAVGFAIKGWQAVLTASLKNVSRSDDE